MFRIESCPKKQISIDDLDHLVYILSGLDIQPGNARMTILNAKNQLNIANYDDSHNGINTNMISELTGFFPRICRIFSSEKIQ